MGNGKCNHGIDAWQRCLLCEMEVQEERIAELERDLAIKTQACENYRRENDIAVADLAAAQATIQQMREAIKLSACPALDCEGGVVDSGGVYQWGEPVMVPCPVCRARHEALALPSDRTALDAMLAEARKEQRENDAKICEANQVNKSPDYLPGTVFDGACRQCADAIRQAAERSADNAELCGRRET